MVRDDPAHPIALLFNARLNSQEEDGEPERSVGTPWRVEMEEFFSGAEEEAFIEEEEEEEAPANIEFK